MHNLSSIAAALFARISTDHQQYSMLSQTTANQRYGDVHGFAIVRSYEDPGRSGSFLQRQSWFGSAASRCHQR